MAICRFAGCCHRSKITAILIVANLLKEFKKMTKTKLHAVSRTQGNNRALKEGEVSLPDFELDFEEVPVLVHGFRRMVRELAYDVCEMAQRRMG